jgi:hypothetical protein
MGEKSPQNHKILTKKSKKGLKSQEICDTIKSADHVPVY